MVFLPVLGRRNPTAAAIQARRRYRPMASGANTAVIGAERSRRAPVDPWTRKGPGEGQQEVAGEARLEVPAAVRPGRPLLEDPGGQPGGGVVQPVSDRLRLRRLDGAVPA